ncbi:MAG: AAA family ATPase [Planctomycetota bacterium]
MSSSGTGASTHIDCLPCIRNIGRFESVRGGTDTAFRPLSLVYSQNGRGKTTLCAILRSLTSGDPTPILERRRLSAATESRAAVSVGGSTVSFNGTRWTDAGPRIVIFDEHFVDANVHSGLSVGAGHRKGIHALVVGEDGVRLQRRVEELTTRISSLQSELRQKERAIPAAARGSLSVDDFCALSPIENLEEELAAATRSLSVLRDAEAIRGTGEFRPFALPPVDLDEIATLLGTTLPDLEAAALAAVTRHFSDLGPGAESWTADGLRYLGAGRTCPFCGQDATATTLITHYRVYFSEAYRTHRQRIQEAHERVGAELSGDRLATLLRDLQREREKREFWARYVKLPELGLDTDELSATWTALRDALLAALDAKAAAPLEPIALAARPVEAARRYHDLAGAVCTVSAALVEGNCSVLKAKEHAAEGSARTAQAQLEHLQAVQRRFQPEVHAHCGDYLRAKLAKTEAEFAKSEARTALDEHRGRVFGSYEAAINRFLDTFNADFKLDELRPSDARGVPSSVYGVRVNGGSVGLNPPRDPSPSFRTALGSGDRNFLALSLFFASLERLDLQDTIVVIDDPISSLDDARASATAQEIQKLQGRCRQLIVLSHSRTLLCQLWERADKDGTATLEIRDEGADRSTLACWDIEAAAVAKARDVIDRLEGFRTAMISAEVTGKIDVRAASTEAPASQEEAQ